MINTVLGRGFTFPANDLIYFTLSSVRVSHNDGYLFIHATPDFAKIDLIKIIQAFMQ